MKFLVRNFNIVLIVGVAALTGFIVFQMKDSGVAVTDNRVAIEPADPFSPIDTSDWITYRDEELGIEFKYPQDIGITIQQDGEPPLGRGRAKIISLERNMRQFAFWAGVSPDYAEYAMESTPFLYIGPSLTGNNDDINNALRNFFYLPLGIEKVTLCNLQGVGFYSFIKGYEYAFNYTYIIPYKKNDYSNLQFSSSLIDSLPEDTSLSKEVRDALAKTWFMESIEKDPIRQKFDFIK